MKLQHLKLLHFKSYGEAEFHFENRLITIVGKNGSGKTNLLDAIHHISFGRSAFHKQDALQICHGEAFYRLDATLEKDGHQNRLELIYKTEEKKKLIWNGAKPEKMAEHVGRIPLVLILPDEPFLMHESSEWRRNFFDNTLSQAFPDYLHHLAEYRKLLAVRNATLKYFFEKQRVDFQLLDTLDEQLIAHSHSIHQYRKRHSPDLHTRIQEAYNWLSSEAEMVHLEYKTELEEMDISNIFTRNRRLDLESQRTNGGIHKDDYLFWLGTFLLKKIGSQGQQKTFLLALKIAQYRFLQHHKNTKPWLLMDDIFDKLDDNRITKLVELIQQPDMGQVFITDARIDRTKSLLEDLAGSYQMIKIKTVETDKRSTIS